MILLASALTTNAFAANPAAPATATPPLWRDASVPIETRVDDLLRQLTTKEKISQLCANTVAIPRLGIPAYSHRNECLHGLSDGTTVSTVFPQAIGMAATWDTPLIQREADAIATEARALYNDYAAKHDGNIADHRGLTYYSPNINIARDPRWGRAQETYGEDPFLTSRMGVAFIRGLQGDDPRLMKILACAKHYVVHSGPEKSRHRMSMNPPERDFRETYLPAFEAAVREARVGSVMGAYSSFRDVPCCANPYLIQDILRKQWGFTGLFVSDGGAIGDIWGPHHYKPTPEECVAAALKAGCDLSSGSAAGKGGGQAFSILQTSLEKKLVTEEQIDRAARNELTARFRTGMFDPPQTVPWSKFTPSADTDTPEHRALALQVAEKSIVLLKNDGILPLDRAKYKRIAVIGPNADSKEMLLGNYHGKSSLAVTIL